MPFPRLTFRNITGFTLTVLLGGVFIFSGISKLNAIQPLAWSMLELVPMKYGTAAIFARLLCSLELVLGAFLTLQLYLRSFTYKATLTLLLILSGYLVWSIAANGNSGNCGCFGEQLYMTPAQALWKNAGMLAALLVCWFLYRPKAYKGAYYAAALAVTAALVTPFVAEPLGAAPHEPINLQSLYSSGVPKPALRLDSGKQVVAYFSLTCPHCKKAAKTMIKLYREQPSLPFFAVLSGHAEDMPEFFKETGAAGIPHTYLQDMEAFKSMAGEYVPQIYWVDNGYVVRKLYYTELNRSEINSWLKTN